MACSTCNAEIEKYKTLKSNISSTILNKVIECNSSAKKVQQSFDKVEISGDKVGADELSSIISNLDSVESNLGILISECDEKIKSKENSCPGANHYSTTTSTTETTETTSETQSS